ncbi:MAG: hypothetical protein V4691_10120 [Pseudomonadota bacterium]
MPFAKIIITTSVACLLIGCNDYLDHNDRMTPFSGEAMAANRAAQMVDPWPASAADRNFSTNGERMMRVMTKYKGGTAPATSSASSGQGSSGGDSGSSSADSKSENSEK